MLKIISTLCATLFIGTIISVYSLSVPDTSFTPINFSGYHNKKILLVNIASGSPQAYQLAGLQQLYAQRHDSLAIVAFPTNSFGNEPKTNPQLATWLQGAGISFPVAAKSDIAGLNANTVYKWLASKQQNDVTAVKLFTDFQKVLIDRNGLVEGIFDSSVTAQNPLLLDAINR